MKYSMIKLSKCHFVHHKSYMDRRGTELGDPRNTPATNGLRHGTVGGSFLGD
jgi:hypothetical protein